MPKKKPRKPAPRQYVLTLSEEQAQVLNQALELYARIGMGQFREVVDHHRMRSRAHQVHGNVGEAEDALERAKVLLTGLSRGAHWSICSPEIDDRYRTAWDLQQVIRHRISWDRTPAGGMTVNFDRPMQTGPHPLPQFRVLGPKCAECEKVRLVGEVLST